MPVVALLHPSPALAELGDPLEVARSIGETLPWDRDAVRAEVRRRIALKLTTLPEGASDGPEDQRWYWAAPFLLDAAQDQVTHRQFLADMRTWGSADDEDGATAFARHVRELQELNASTLGRRPADLVEVVADLALAGPGVCALRALARVTGGRSVWSDSDLRWSAADVSWGLRSLFNRPEIMALVRQPEASVDTYWRAVLKHCLDGNLQSVLDEYSHVLVESEGLQEKSGVERARRLAEVMEDALTIRTSVAGVDELALGPGSVRLEGHRARTHFAMRFGRAVSEDNATQREATVRTAFNSPFWPFVLASTSVGQEGLDFHTYSHAVVHWNLPGNPVDLEQREGRVHRYKGHAVRRNVAQGFSHAAFHASVDDPWFAMFLAASETRPLHETEIFPYWVCTVDGGAKIERYVPATPLSRESARYARLKRTVGAYRSVIGQPRQEDLLRYVGGADASWMTVDLSPSPRQVI
jgi:hypothetical protein